MDGLTNHCQQRLTTARYRDLFLWAVLKKRDRSVTSPMVVYTFHFLNDEGVKIVCSYVELMEQWWEK